MYGHSSNQVANQRQNQGSGPIQPQALYQMQLQQQQMQHSGDQPQILQNRGSGPMDQPAMQIPNMFTSQPLGSRQQQVQFGQAGNQGFGNPHDMSGHPQQLRPHQNQQQLGGPYLQPHASPQLNFQQQQQQQQSSIQRQQSHHIMNQQNGHQSLNQQSSIQLRNMAQQNGSGNQNQFMMIPQIGASYGAAPPNHQQQYAVPQPQPQSSLNNQGAVAQHQMMPHQYYQQYGQMPVPFGQIAAPQLQPGLPGQFILPQQSSSNQIQQQPHSNSSNIRIQQSVSDMTDEFDEDFFRNRPLQHISGNAILRGHSGVSQQLSNEEELQQQIAQSSFINPCDNNYKNKKKIGGLNENRKGKITQIDRDRLQQQSFSQQNERLRNQMFKKQPKECVQRSIENKKAQQQQFEQEKDTNEMRVRQMLQMIDVNVKQIEIRNRQMKEDIEKAFANAQNQQPNVQQQNSLGDLHNASGDIAENLNRNLRLNLSFQQNDQPASGQINSSSLINDNNHQISKFGDQGVVPRDQMFNFQKVIQEIKQELRQEFRNKMRSQRQNIRDLEEQKELDNNDGSIFSSVESERQNSQSNAQMGSNSNQNAGQSHQYNRGSHDSHRQRLNRSRSDNMNRSPNGRSQFQNNYQNDQNQDSGLDNVPQYSSLRPQSLRIRSGNRARGSDSSVVDQMSENRDEVGQMAPNPKLHSRKKGQSSLASFGNNMDNNNQIVDRSMRDSLNDVTNEDDSADEESEKLRASYETYGLLLVQRNQKKKQDQRVQELRSIYENSSERGSSSEKGKKPKLNKLKSGSLRNFKFDRSGSIPNKESARRKIDQLKYHEMSLNAGLASNRKLRSNQGQSDDLLFQIEDQRRTLFDNILDIIKVKNNRKQKLNHIVNNISSGVGSGSSGRSYRLMQEKHGVQDELDLDYGKLNQVQAKQNRYQHLSKNDRVLCKALDEINVEDFSADNIVQLSKEEKKKLWDMLSSYKKVAQDQIKYMQVDRIENESNSQSSELLSDVEPQRKPSKKFQSQEKFENAKERNNEMQQKISEQRRHSQNPKKVKEVARQGSLQRVIDQQLQQQNVDGGSQRNFKKHSKKVKQDQVKISKLQLYKMERGKRGSSAFMNENEQLEDYDSEKQSKQSNADGAENDKEFMDCDKLSQQSNPADSQAQNEIKQIRIDKIDVDEEQDEEDEDDEGSEHQIAADLQSLGAYAPSLRSIGRRNSIQSLDPQMIKKFALKYNPFADDKQSVQSKKPFFEDNQSQKSKKFVNPNRESQDFQALRAPSQKDSENFYRDEKVKGLDLEYNLYLQQYQATFVLSCQMLNFELVKIKKKGYDMRKMMLQQNNFSSLQDQIQQDPMFYNSQTIVMDIENTLVSKLDVRNAQELQNLKQLDNYQLDYVIIKKHQNKGKERQTQGGATPQSICCPDTPNCFCDTMVYQIRPYTYEFLRAIQPFFEIVVFSRMHHKIIENIINHIESVLNKPIKQFLERQRGQPRRGRFGRGKKLPDEKLYFQFIFHQRQYIHIKEIDRYVENLLLLTKNRKQEDLIYISSNPFRIINALNENFLALPVIPFETNKKNEFQLCLLENYILKYRHHREMRDRLHRDFTFLLNQVKEQSDVDDARSHGSIKSRRNVFQQRESNSDVHSIGSFGPKVIEKVAKKKGPQQAYSKFRPYQGKLNNKFNQQLQKSKFSQQDDDDDDLEDYEEEDDDDDNSVSEMEDNSIPSPNSGSNGQNLPMFNKNLGEEEIQPQSKRHYRNQKKQQKNFQFSNSGEGDLDKSMGDRDSEEIDVDGFFNESSTPRKSNSSPIEVGQVPIKTKKSELSVNKEVNCSAEESANSLGHDD